MASADQVTRHVSFDGAEIEQAAAGDINNYYLNSRKLNPAECWELKQKVQQLEAFPGQSAKAIWTELKKTLGVGLQDYRLEHKDTAHRLLDLMLAAAQANAKASDALRANAGWAKRAEELKTENQRLKSTLAAHQQTGAGQLQKQKQLTDTAARHKEAAESDVRRLHALLQQAQRGRRTAWLTALTMLSVTGWLALNQGAVSEPEMVPPACSVRSLTYSPGVVADLPGQGAMRCELDTAGRAVWVNVVEAKSKKKR